MTDILYNYASRLKAGDVIILPEYRPDPAVVLLNRFRIEQPILARYDNGDIVAPRYFDAVIIVGKNMRVKAMKNWLESAEARQLMHDHREHCDPKDEEQRQMAENFFFALNGLNFVPGGAYDHE